MGTGFGTYSPLVPTLGKTSVIIFSIEKVQSKYWIKGKINKLKILIDVEGAINNKEIINVY